MSDVSGVPEALRLLDLLIESVDWQGMLSAPLSKSDVVARLGELRVALVDVIPEWAEVTISEVFGERDRARSLAVRLEQELAEAEEWIDVYKSYVRELEAQAAVVSP